MYGELTDVNLNEWVTDQLAAMQGDSKVETFMELLQLTKTVTFGPQEVLQESCQMVEDRLRHVVLTSAQQDDRHKQINGELFTERHGLFTRCETET